MQRCQLCFHRVGCLFDSSLCTLAPPETRLRFFLNYYFYFSLQQSTSQISIDFASKPAGGGECPGLLNYSRVDRGGGGGAVGAAVRRALRSQTIVICINHIARECKGSKSLSACRDGCLWITCYRSEEIVIIVQCCSHTTCCTAVVSAFEV